jgi:quercetin dioxygenase-like cupin family protein
MEASMSIDISVPYRVRALPLVATLLLALLVPSHWLSAQNGAKLKWGAPPAVFPHGAKMAVVSGDPTKSGPFTVQLKMPKGYRIPPHFHPTDEHVTVKSGTLLVGMGDKLDLKAAKKLKKGEDINVAANMHHYAATKGKTTIEVSAAGPFAMTYVNAADDPTKH